MPEFDDHPHGPGGPHGGSGWHDEPGWHGGPGRGHGPGWGGPGWDGPGWGPLPGLLLALLMAGLLLRLTGYDRVLAERLRALLSRDDARAGWRSARDRYDRTAAAFAAYECDPAAVLARPALADVTRPATARFVEEFAVATALRTDEHPGTARAAEFVAAAEAAERAWSAAVDAADRSRAAGFAPGERALLDQTVKLLATAESTAHEGERHAAYRRAMDRLSELERRTGWALPRSAAVVLQHRARGMLTVAG